MSGKARQGADAPVPCPDAATAAARLDTWFADCPSVIVAFSGGVDSALVAYWARRCLGHGRATACTSDSPSLKRTDLETARAFCRDHDVVLRVIATNEIDNPDYVANPVNRCFHCKSTLYRTIVELVADKEPRDWILSGANLDDMGDYRPGLMAAAHAMVRHPLLECGIGKPLIRDLARRHGLAVWDKPASPCLSSRIPYGEEVTREKLARIEAAEHWLSARGFPVCRVRHFGDTACVEAPADQVEDARAIWPELVVYFASLGFARVELDEEGFVSGKLNRAIGWAAIGAER